MPEPAVVTRSLTKRYGEVVGIEDLTLTVERGEVLGLLGPNGAGKSTAIRTLLGFQSPTSGGASLLGTDVTDRRAFTETRAAVGYLPSDFEFYGSVTGSTVLDYYGRLKGDERREELLERFPVPADRPVKTYSRGNKQKLAIVQAFMHDPELVVMDEPTTGLDPMVQSEFRALVEAERDAGKTVLFSSHILGEVRQVCDRVAIVRGGRLVECAPVEELLARPGKLVRATFRDPPDPADFDGPGVTDLRVHGDTVEFVATDATGLLDRLGRADPVDVEIREADIETVFMRYYEREDEPGESDGEGTDAEGDIP